jgi:hypothetical protein
VTPESTSAVKAALAEGRKGGAFLSDAALVATGAYRLPGQKRRPEQRLVEPIVFELGATGSGLFITVPVGYVTDGYSLPGRLLQLFQPRTADFLLPAILHDWLYDTGLVPRDMCDRILLQAMRAVGVAPWQRAIVNVAVRCGGGGGFARPLPVNLACVRQARASLAFDALLTFMKGTANV